MPGGFLERMHEGTWLGHVAEHVALQLQQEAGHDLRRGKTRQVKGRRGVYNVVYAYSDERVGLAAGQLAVRLINHLVRPEEGFDFPEQLTCSCAGPSGWPSARRPRRSSRRRSAATSRGSASTSTPWCSSARASTPQRIRATMTSRTGALAVDIAGDKDLTTKLLASAGLPVPRSESVRTAEAAVAAADRIGYPVVVKPLDGNHGRGVCLDLGGPDAVRAAFDIAEGESRRGSVMVESFITGRDYRCLIVGGRMQAIAERVPAHVVGDGEHTVPSWSTSPTPTRGGASGTRRC